MPLTFTTVTPTLATAASGVATSSSFTPAAGEWVYLSFTWLNTTNINGETFVISDSLGNTYSNIVPAISPGTPFPPGYGGTYVGVARFFYANSPGSITVKVTASTTSAGPKCFLGAVRFAGADTAQTGAATATNPGTGGVQTTNQISITPSQLNSYILLAGALNGTGTFTNIANTTTVGQASDATTGEAAAVGMSAAVTASTSVTTYGWTNTSETFGTGAAAVEIIPAAAAVPVAPAAAPLVPPGFQSPAALSRLLPSRPAPPGGGLWSASASMDGAGAFQGTALVTAPGTAGLSGHGDLAASGSIGGAQLTGVGVLGATGTDVKPGAAGLTGHGDLAATGQAFVPGAAGLAGVGNMTATGVFAASAGMTGTGVLTVGRTVTHRRTAGLTGIGTFVPAPSTFYAGLAGVGSFSAVWKQGYVAGLTGIGFLSIPQVAGGLVNGVGGVSTSQALPGTSQVAVAPPGTTDWHWIGTLGQVTALKYSFAFPGGCDKMSTTVMVPATYRTQLFNPGWQVKIVRGGHQVWSGKLDEPVPTTGGWNLTAVGAGNRGQDFLAYYAAGDTWPTSEPDEILNRAIARGLPWVNPGLNSSPLFSQFWFGQGVDPAGQSVTALMNLLCTRGGLTWYVNSQPGGQLGNSLAVMTLPTTPNRLLVCTQPVARTLGGDTNYIFIRYQVSADDATSGAVASYDYVAATNQASINVHGEIETYVDLSDVGVMTAAAAQAVGTKMLAIYQRASFAGPFTGGYGQLLNSGGVAIDPGAEQAGSVVKLLLTDFGYGGEVTLQFPLTFAVGAYEWDDYAQQFSITPYQSFDQSLTGMLSTYNTVMTPIAAAGS